MIKTIGDLKKAIKHLDDDDIIYAVTAYPEHKILDILCVEDSTSIGFWEIHLYNNYTAYTSNNTIKNE